jgi:hypothetical protein
VAFKIARWTWPDRLVLCVLVLVIAVSALPWFGRAVAEGDRAEFRTLRFNATAWEASTQWSIAILLAVVAGVGWLLLRAVGRAGPPVGLICLLLVGCSVWLTVRRWHSIPRASGHDAVITVVLPRFTSSPSYVIQRDHLSIDHGTGYSADVRYGLYVGLLVLCALFVTLLVAALTRSARNGPTQVE